MSQSRRRYWTERLPVPAASRSATMAASPSECLPPVMPVYLPDCTSLPSQVSASSQSTEVTRVTRSSLRSS